MVTFRYTAEKRNIEEEIMRFNTTPARALCLLIAVLGTSPLLAAPRVEVPQGGVGRWSGEGTESCGMDGRTWSAIEETCYYPVDLQRRPGTVEIARWRDGGSIETGWLVIQEKGFELQEIEIDDKFVHLSEENLARLYREQGEIKPLFRRRSGEARFTLPLAAPLNPPVPEGRFFGLHRTFNGEPKNDHTGIDYAVGMGNPVKAVADGTVLLTGDHFFAGQSVFVYHGDGLVSMYFHLSEITAEAGQEVAQGDAVGKVGSTGRSTGPHLHLGFRWRGARVDPNLLLQDPAGLPSVAE
jgi:hypothetical protein